MKPEKKKRMFSKENYSTKKFLSFLGSKAKKFEDLDPKIQKLILDTGTKISNQEDLTALAEISVQELVELFERIAKGMSKKEALINITKDLKNKRKEKEEKRKIRERDYEKKMVELKKKEVFLDDKIYLGEQYLETKRKELSVKIAKLRLEKKEEDEAELEKDKKSLQEQIQLLKNIIEIGKKVKENLQVCIDDAEEIVKEENKKSIARLEKREIKDREKYEQSIKDFENEIKNIEKKFNTEFKMNEISLKELAEINEMLKQEELKVNNQYKNETKEKEYKNHIKIIDSHNEYIQRITFFLDQDLKVHKDLHYDVLQLQTDYDKEEECPDNEYKKKSTDYTLTLLEDEILLLEDIKANDLQKFEEIISNLRKNEIQILTNEDKELEKDLREKNNQLLKELEMEKAKIEANLEEIEVLKGRRMKREIFNKNYLKNFNNFCSFLKTKLKYLNEEETKKLEKLKNLKEAESDNENLKEKRVFIVEKELTLTQNMKKTTEKYDEILKDLKNQAFTLWEDTELELEEIEEKLLEYKKLNPKMKGNAVIDNIKKLKKRRNTLRLERSKHLESINNILKEGGDISTMEKAINKTTEETEKVKKGEDSVEEENKDLPTKCAEKDSEKEKDQEKHQEKEESKEESAEQEKELEAHKESVDEEVLEEEVLEEEVLEETLEEEPLDEEPLDEEPLDEEPLDEEPLDEEPLDENMVEEEPLDESMIEEEGEGESEKQLEISFEDYKNLEKELKNKTDNLFPSIKKIKKLSEVELSNLMTAYKEHLTEYEQQIESKLFELETIEDFEKQKRKMDLSKQLKIINNLGFFNSKTNNNIKKLIEKKEEVIKRIEKELETCGEGKEDFVQYCNNKKMKLKTEIKELLECGDMGTDLNQKIEDLRTNCRLMFLTVDKDSEDQLRKEKKILFGKYKDSSNELTTKLSKFSELEGDAKQTDFIQKVDKFEEIEGLFFKKKEQISVDFMEIEFLLRKVNEQLKSDNYTLEEKTKLEEKKKSLEAQKKEFQDIELKIDDYEDTLKALKNQAFQIYVVEEDEEMKRIEEKEALEFEEFSLIVDEFEFMSEEFEAKALPRRKRRRRDETKTEKTREDKLNEGEIEMKIKEIKEIEEMINNSTDETEKLYLGEKRNLLVQQIRFFGLKIGLKGLDKLEKQDDLDNVGKSADENINSYSKLIEEEERELIEKQKRLEELRKQSEDLIKREKLEQEANAKIEELQKIVAEKQKELETQVVELKKTIEELKETEANENKVEKEKIWSKFKMEMVIEQVEILEKTIFDISKMKDDLIQVKKTNLEDKQEKTRKLEKLFNEVEKRMNLDVKNIQTKIEAKEQEFSQTKEEAFEEDVKYEITIDDFETQEFLSKQFKIIKFDPKKRLLSRKNRLYEVDFMHHKVKNMTRSAKIKKTMKPEDLITVERYINNLKGLRLLFTSARHSYELIFQSNKEREELYSLVAGIRPHAYSWCPALCQGKSVRCVATIKGMVNDEVEETADNQAPVEVKKTMQSFKLSVTKKAYEESFIWINTWNIENKVPSEEELASMVPIDSNYDFYILGFQQSGMRKNINLENYVSTALKAKENGLYIIKSTQLYKIQLIIICQKTHASKISNVEVSMISYKKTKQKGSVAISFNFNESSMLFISSHFADNRRGIQRNELREKNYIETFGGLKHGYKCMDFYNQFDYVFWLGDFNYTVVDNNALAYIESKKFKLEELLKKDRLRIEKEAGKIFCGFDEPEITFKPTFPIEPKTKELDNIDKIPPSYPSRIFHKSLPNTKIESIKYEPQEITAGSCYFPVSGLFKVNTRLPYNIIFEKNDKREKIEIKKIGLLNRKDDSKKIGKPRISFYSNFVSEYIHSEACDIKNDDCIEWREGKIPIIYPNIRKCVLGNENLYICVRSGLKDAQDYSNVIATATLSLKEPVNEIGKPYTFDCPAYSKGKYAGNIKGELTINQF